MSKSFNITATPKDGFWRCGHHFTNEGEVFARDDFSEAEWKRLENERLLTVSEVDGEEASKSSEPQVTKLNADELAGWIRTAIPQIEGDDLGQGGKPKLEALRAKIVELATEEGVDEKAIPAKISGKARDAVWADLVAEGLVGGGTT